MAAAKSQEADSLAYLINHVFLPPKLPQGDDGSSTRQEQALVASLLDALDKFNDLEPGSRPSTLKATQVLERFQSVLERSDNDKKREKIREIIYLLKDGDSMLLHIKAQNAGLLITQRHDDVLFEAFELLATNTAVMSCKGRLIRQFPDSAASVSRSLVHEKEAHFLDQFLDVVCELASESVAVARPTTHKGGEIQLEERETASPLLVTDMLLGVLAGLGTRVEAQSFEKRSREQVSWSDSRLPFHRSPSWMLLRVALRLIFDRGVPQDGSQSSWYKPFLAFYHSCLLKRATKEELDSDLLFAMMGKLARRIVKLDPAKDSLWLKDAMQVVQKTRNNLESRWKRIEGNNAETLDFSSLADLSFEKDSDLRQESLKKFLDWTKTRSPTAQYAARQDDSASFKPFLATELPSLGSNIQKSVGLRPFVLLEAETWVEDNLDSWVARQLQQGATKTKLQDTLGKLDQIICEYYSEAHAAYAGNPEALSTMFLTIMSLWIAVDRVAGSMTPLLLEYDPELSPAMLYDLLLPTEAQMSRLCNIEKYFHNRKANATSGYPSAFSGFGSASSLANRYFEISPKHQSLLNCVNERTEKMAQNKVQELREKHARHDELSAQLRMTSHEKRGKGRRRDCIRDCAACQLVAAQEALHITILESPLPSNILEAKAVIFEISVPGSVSVWRSATRKLAVDIFPQDDMELHNLTELYHAYSHSGLQDLRTSNSVLHPSSTVKPFEISHYKSYHIKDATIENVKLPNGCRFEYRDELSGLLSLDLYGHSEVPSYCSLAAGYSAPLEDWIRSTKHIPNEVIAAQSECPPNMSPDEFRAFGNLRSGLEAGEPNRHNSSCRRAHLDTQQHTFINNMVGALHDALDRISGSWQNDVALSLLVCLATRVLSLLPQILDGSSLLASLLEYLSRIRSVSLTWARQLHETLSHARAYLYEALESPQGVAYFVEAAVLVHDHQASATQDTITSILLHRYRTVMHHSRAHVTETIERDSSGLGNGIRNIWAGYPPSTRWRACKDQQAHMLESFTVDGNTSTNITLNLLTGSLLVNGYPLSKLPQEYQTHPTFVRLFGGQVLEVMPMSTIDGMQFSTCREQMEWTVHFALIEKELVIQAQKRSRPDIWEYIPHERLEGDFSATFLNDYSHWLNLATGDIEFRPTEQPWVSSADTWTLTRVGDRAVLMRDDSTVIDQNSKTALHLARILRSIESKIHIDLVFHEGTRVLSIELPRFGLSFTLAERESTIISKNHSRMCIDESQGIGTLVGLMNRLVLRPQSVSSFKPRVVIIPRGLPVTTSIHDHHVRVSIHSSVAKRIEYDAFQIGCQLRRLTDSGRHAGKLYLAYLHALTSHCLPDPLTARTGTEQAQSILRSAAVMSFQYLGNDSRNLLNKIAALSPVRSYYPKHLENMEQTGWAPGLPPLSQHDDFLPLAQDIVDHAKDCEVIYPTSESMTAIDEILKPLPGASSEKLTERARFRNAALCVSEFGAESQRGVYQHDLRYSGRHDKSSDKIRRAVGVTRCLTSDKTRLVERPSDGLKEAIIRITGTEFNGDTSASLDFHPHHFQSPKKVFSKLWGGLHAALAAEKTPFRTIFFLSSLIFAEDSNFDIVQALMSFAPSNSIFVTDFRVPRVDFNLHFTWDTMAANARRIVEENKYKMEQCPEGNLPQDQSEKKHEYDARRFAAWKPNSKSMASSFVSELNGQWASRPTAVTQPSRRNYDSYMDVGAILKEIGNVRVYASNTAWFHKYLDVVVKKLANVDILPALPAVPGPAPGFSLALTGPRDKATFIDAIELFLSMPAPSTERPLPELFEDLLGDVHAQAVGAENARLGSLLDELSTPDMQVFQHNYVEELKRSLVSIEPTGGLCFAGSQTAPARFEQHLQICQERSDAIYRAICNALGGSESTRLSNRVCDIARLWPRISPVFLLQRLTCFYDKMSVEWRNCLINYALSLAYLQRAQRLKTAFKDPSRRSDFAKELLNPGTHHEGEEWSMQRCQSLVLEVEQGILIRQVQHRIAGEMMHPPEGQNSVMQLNMGEGKSSVIVPIIAAALADGTRLLRVVVAKPQSKQMMHTLVGKLGGLLNRRVFQLPLSRANRLTHHGVQVLKRLIDTCKRKGGVMLVQPEHLLSFKLMGLEVIWSEQGRFSGSGKSPGQSILGTYIEFEAISRDIVDESDENFSAKFELIYTMGSQQPVEMSPDRWFLIQELLDVVAESAKVLCMQHNGISDGILCEAHEGRFPTIRILTEEAGDRLIDAVAKHVCQRGLKGFQIQHQPARMRNAVQSYINSADYMIDVDDAAAMVESASSGLFEETATRNKLLLLRGLLAKGVAKFALSQKRYRVNYGLAPDRLPPTRLAVPFRAKDSPAPRSEFSHPDVVIILTCLSYYYRGLSDEELGGCLELLSTSDQAEQEYGAWVSASLGLPEAFRHFSSVNLKDLGQCRELVFPALRFAKPAVDYYLFNVVFSREMREFKFKLSASGWDLAKPKTHPLTGFSGTNDSKYVLPLSVQALDLPEQRHTNAAVLSRLLRDENNVMEFHDSSQAQSSSTLTVDMLLKAVTSKSRAKPMRVILDVGAQIIELSNLQVAQRWLSSVPSEEVDAVIFFNDLDELSVLNRQGAIDAFLTSPFASHTDRCLVFLDQAHTRGTDLVLPDWYRAAVTLGPGITKDTLVQACMRMRKLGDGQSITFCVSGEMRNKIQKLRHQPGDNKRPISVADILAWAISETWDEALRSVPLWATQGVRHSCQEIIWQRDEGELSATDVQDYLEEEAQSLEQRYRPVTAVSTHTQGLMLKIADLAMGPRKDDAALIEKKILDFCISDNTDSAGLQEEQERELAPETEREVLVERPAPQKARAHRLHDDVKFFVMNGVIRSQSPAFMPAFQVMTKTSAAALLPDGSGFPCDLLVTADFARTVDDSGVAFFCADCYQKDVQWVLTSTTTRSDSGSSKEKETTPHGMQMVVISQFEADELKTVLQTNRPPFATVILHAYLPRLSLTYRSLENLNLYTIPTVGKEWTAPPALVMQLNLFAGQLYLGSYLEYMQLCRYLGLSYKENKGDKMIGADGFVGGYDECKFKTSPVGFLSVVFKRIRRGCVNIEKTHMGRILGGEILRKRDFVVEKN
ncbi:hypothetical protein B0T17DRAFT_589950 [Bombardia bombarda]|uniref:ubiquitinyl hydrolase 1 n=1 Tax=Bombardia bombarda TaxID=252184 RepID=A0AA39XAN7_9PEZI|nr:hypothetical protein B0T17DRAFT_589950 [Bombardia bombarda]